jgi:hypothetical protein
MPNKNGIYYEKSTRKDKKWMSKLPDGKIVHWGDPNMEDYTEHKNDKRREAYRKRAEGILLKDGTRAIDKKYSPAWFAYYITW